MTNLKTGRRVRCHCGGLPCHSYFQSQEDDWGFEDTWELCSLKLLERPNKSNHVFLFLKMLKVYLITIGRTFTIILPHLMSWGFDVEWQVLNSKDFMFPQNRERASLHRYLERKVPDSYFLQTRRSQLTLDFKILGIWIHQKWNEWKSLLSQRSQPTFDV